MSPLVTQDRDETERMVVRVAGHLCRRFRRGAADRHDVEQEGRVAAILAIRRYSSKRSKETTYVYKAVRGRMIDVLTESAGPMRIPSDALYKTKATVVSDRRAHAARVRDMKCVCPSVLDEVAIRDGDPTVERAERTETMALAKESIGTLTEVERLVIEGLFGLDCVAETPTALARRLNMSYWRLIRLRERGLRKLKMWLRNKGVDEDDCGD